MMAISMSGARRGVSAFGARRRQCDSLFAPVCTTSSKLLTASFTVASLSSASLQFFSRNSRTVFELRPMATAFHAEYMPDGSVM